MMMDSPEYRVGYKGTGEGVVTVDVGYSVLVIDYTGYRPTDNIGYIHISPSLTPTHNTPANR